MIGKQTLGSLVVATAILTSPFIPGCGDSSAPPEQKIAITKARPAESYFRETTEDYEKRMDWFKKAKFGIFAHWNPCSMTGKEISSKIPMEYYRTFNPVKFNADEWTQIIKDSGAKYFVYTAKHHDGFCMWDTATTDFKITDPEFRTADFRRDVVRELAEACQRQGIKFLAYYSPPDFNNPDYKLYNENSTADLQAKERFLAFMRAQVGELLEYPIDGIWFDSYLGLQRKIDTKFSKRLANSQYYEDLGEILNARGIFELIHKRRPEAIINDRLGLLGDIDTFERRVGNYDPKRYFESCITLTDQWGWEENGKVKSLEDCMGLLINCVGRGGNLLMNVGPNQEGIIEPKQVQRLKEMGAWLKKHGKSIYETRPALGFSPRPNRIATKKGNTIYLHIVKPAEQMYLPPNFSLRKKKITCITPNEIEIVDREQGREIRVLKKSEPVIATVIKIEPK